MSRVSLPRVKENSRTLSLVDIETNLLVSSFTLRSLYSAPMNIFTRSKNGLTYPRRGIQLKGENISF